MKPYYLYKITNLVNGKLYIGMTTNPQKRFKQHMSGSSSQILSSAVRKYGKESFKIEVLVVGSKDYIADLECSAIALYGTRDKEVGYNIKPGGETGISGYSFKTTTKDKWQYASGFWFPNPRTAVKSLGIDSSTFKRRRKEGVLGDTIQSNLNSNWEATPVYVAGFWWGSVFEASKSLNVSKEALKTRIRKAALEQGFLVRDQSGNNNHMHNIHQEDHPSSKGVVVNGVTYPSIKQATDCTGISKYIITSRIKESHPDFSFVKEEHHV